MTAADPFANPGLPSLDAIAAHEANGGRWLITSHYPPRVPVQHLARLRVRDGAVEAGAWERDEWEPLDDFCNVVEAEARP